MQLTKRQHAFTATSVARARHLRVARRYARHRHKCRPSTSTGTAGEQPFDEGQLERGPLLVKIERICGLPLLYSSLELCLELFLIACHLYLHTHT